MPSKRKRKAQKKASLPSLRRKALKLWTEKVKAAQGNVCAVCGIRDGTPNGKTNKNGREGATYINAHHIEDKTNYALRWDVINGVALCPSHHEFGKDSAHRSPVWFIQWLKDRRPRVLDYVAANRSCRPQTADGYDRDAMMGIVARLAMPLTDEELSILNLERPGTDGDGKAGEAPTPVTA